MNTTIYVSLWTFFLGLLLGHRLALWRERRKEFNEVALRIRIALKDHLANMRPGQAIIKKEDMELFSHLLPWWRKRGFVKACASYTDACINAQQQTCSGELYYRETQHIVKALNHAISFTSLR